MRCYVISYHDFAIICRRTKHSITDVSTRVARLYHNKYSLALILLSFMTFIYLACNLSRKFICCQHAVFSPIKYPIRMDLKAFSRTLFINLFRKLFHLLLSCCIFCLQCARRIISNTMYRQRSIVKHFRDEIQSSIR
jgi:hypothetical protein